MILARSPYIVEINETGQTQTRIELFLWNGTGSAPAIPTYSLSKLIPATNQTATYYNIAPFIREYFNFIYSYPDIIGNNVLPNEYTYCNVKIITYATIGGTDTEINNTQTIATDGYGYYEDEMNPTVNTVGNILLSNLSIGTRNIPYTYLCDSNSTTIGTITLLGTSYYPGIDRLYVVYTSLDNSVAQIEIDVTQSDIVNFSKVYADFISVGNLFSLRYDDEAGTTIVWEAYFEPQCECKYEAVKVDFINRFGAWQREWFYKASNETLDITNNTYKINPNPINYNLYQGQFKNFNNNGKISIKVNSGFVHEQYKIVIQELMLSEVIRINDFPATLKTKSVEKYKEINTKQINYSLDFEMAYDKINSIV
jgi:hypothetical protein